MTVTTVHQPQEDLALEKAAGLVIPDLFVERAMPDSYEVPIAQVEHVRRETESYVAWVVVLGFVAYALALYWAERCNRRGGDPVIRFSALRGLIVKCIK